MIANFSHWLSVQCGRPFALFLCILATLLWAISFPIFKDLNTWQLVYGTASSVVALIMMFVLQSSSNTDTVAIQKKLDELIRSNQNAKNELIGIEKKDIT